MDSFFTNDKEKIFVKMKTRHIIFFHIFWNMILRISLLT